MMRLHWLVLLAPAVCLAQQSPPPPPDTTHPGPTVIQTEVKSVSLPMNATAPGSAATAAAAAAVVPPSSSAPP
ncbi:MAG TPA: hypothetical protein VK807_16010, partial [Gemmatimonadaceae bacterium]|nr:hypothetical protein [Gemmatimonadaceae bacterium]